MTRSARSFIISEKEGEGLINPNQAAKRTRAGEHITRDGDDRPGADWKDPHLRACSLPWLLKAEVGVFWLLGSWFIWSRGEEGFLPIRGGNRGSGFY